MFISAFSFCKSLQCLSSTLTQGGKGGHLFRLICSVVLWGGRDTANRYRWPVWGVLAVDGPHWVCPSSQCVCLPGSTLSGFRVLCRHCLKWALHFVYFPGLSHSGSRILTSIESVMPSSHLILCRPLLLLSPIPPSIRVFSNGSTLHMRWPKYLRFSFSISPSNEHPGLISFRMDWLDLLAVQGKLKSRGWDDMGEWH